MQQLEGTAKAGQAASSPQQQPFLSDIQTLRQRARQHMEEGAVTPGYGADRQTVIKLLNAALATEIVCQLRYKRHYYMADGIDAESAKAEFLEHANDEAQHADKIAERIVQLGGEPDYSPDGLATRSHAEYVPGTTLRNMIEEDLVAERVAIESYREIVLYLADRDPTTRRLMEEVLAAEEEHADDLVSLLKGMRA
ncbi:MAG: ferritin-like domain-containing protein [Rhodospirillaceae bacterium]